GFRRHPHGLRRADARIRSKGRGPRRIRFLAPVRCLRSAGRGADVPAVGLQSPPGAAGVIINQWVPAAHKGDAIGDSARRMRGLLRRMGHASDLYALTIDDELKGDVRPFDDPASKAGDVTIFHFALPSPMTEAFAQLSGTRLLQYHNVTPASYFAAYDPALFRLASIARQELSTLVGRVDLALGVSDYNRRELEAMGFEPTGVLPLAVDLSRITRPVSRPALEKILDGDFVN